MKGRALELPGQGGWPGIYGGVMHARFALMANYAEVQGQLLYVMGGGWAFYMVDSLPGDVGGFFGASLEFDPDEAVSGVLSLSVTSPDGQPLGLLGSMVASNSPSGEPAFAVLALPVRFAAPIAGQYRITLSIDDEPLTAIDIDVRVT